MFRPADICDGIARERKGECKGKFKRECKEKKADPASARVAPLDAAAAWRLKYPESRISYERFSSTCGPFMRFFLVLLLSGLFAALSSAATAAPAKLALVIGNAKYPDNDVAMNDATNDAQDIADELKRDGFEVDRGMNLTGDGMRRALERFYAKIQPGSIALFFFDGFGIQSARQTYLLPVDAQIWMEADVVHDGFNIETVLGEMNTRGASVKVALIEAARRNPFERRFRRYSAGLAPAVTPGNTLVLYSAALGSVIGSVRADHGLFVTELLREIRAPGTSAEQALRNTQAGVISATRGEQVPWLSSSLTTEFSFVEGAPPPSPSPTPTPTSSSTPSPTPTPTPRPTSSSPTPSPTHTPTCVPPAAPRSPSAAELANDPRIREYTRRIEQDRSDRIAYYKRGQLYAIKRAYAPAVLDFDQAIRLNVQDAEAYNNRCWTRAATGDLLNALRDCDRALQLKPDNADALDSRGLVNLKLGRYPEAISDYSASLEKNSHSVSSMFGRGLALKGAGRDGTADLDQARSMDHTIASEFAGYGVNECKP
jgi:tetratricopeptide (TPR) repeat protein